MRLPVLPRPGCSHGITVLLLCAIQVRVARISIGYARKARRTSAQLDQQHAGSRNFPNFLYFECSIQVAVDYLGERTLFTPEQLVAMLLVDLKAIANTDGSPVSDCVASVPAFFAVSERRAMLNATQITGINCLRLMPETTATALAYGIYKTDLPEKDPVNVVFVDVGYTSLQASISSKCQESKQ